MRQGARRGRKKRLERVFERWWLDIEPTPTRGLDETELALRVAHRRTGHHSMCGLEMFPCVACEAAWHAAKASGRRSMLVALGMAEEFDEGADTQALMWAGTYQTYLSDSGSRMGLMGWPQEYSDIALVGDMVAHRAQRKMMDDIKRSATD